MPLMRSFSGLRGTISELRRYQRQWGSLISAVTDSQLEPAPGHLTEVTDFGSDPGNLRMLAHVPADLPDGAALVVALHGCTQTAGTFDRGTGWSELADRAGFAVLLPEQRRANNPNVCFNWFQPEDIARGEGEALSIREMIGWMIDAHGIDPARVYITGLSAGGAMTAAMLATYPELFAGGAVIAGLPYGRAGGVREALNNMRHGDPAPPEILGALVRAASPHRGPWPAVQIWHGTADYTVSVVNAQELVKQWTDIHGLAPVPTSEDHIGPHAHLEWTDRKGRALVEYYAIAGMGHGVPIVPATEDDPESCGEFGPFMLDAGISSTYRIAASWGLVPAASPVRAIMAAKAADVGAVITTALRKAGLLRDE
jgi:poly(hydroxyalkanoate) depolymerase family esterase